MDRTDRIIINELQKGFPVCDRPYQECGRRLGITETELIARLDALLRNGDLTRFGPLFNADRFGGGLTLCAMQIPDDQFDRIAGKINAFSEVAHNYQRDHDLNMWFVIATETPENIDTVIADIERQTGYTVYNFPKQQEYFVGLHLEV